MDSTKILLKTVDSCPHINNTNITYNIGGQPVFKDQCERCYENQVIYIIYKSNVRMVLIYV